MKVRYTPSMMQKATVWQKVPQNVKEEIRMHVRMNLNGYFEFKDFDVSPEAANYLAAYQRARALPGSKLP